MAKRKPRAKNVYFSPDMKSAAITFSADGAYTTNDNNTQKITLREALLFGWQQIMDGKFYIPHGLLGKEK